MHVNLLCNHCINASCSRHNLAWVEISQNPSVSTIIYPRYTDNDVTPILETRLFLVLHLVPLNMIPYPQCSLSEL